MSVKVINTILKFRRANAADWVDTFVLQAGEPGFELDTGKLKIGNGVTPWNQLDYIAGTGIINANGALEYNVNSEALQMVGFSGAAAGTVPTKTQDGSLSWQTLLTENTIITSNTINNWVEQKINNISSRVYKGEAANFYQDQSTGTITLRDENQQIISAEQNDVYSYEGTNYLWTGTEWVELTGSEIYATASELNALSTLINNHKTAIAASNILGHVKSSSETNEINVDSSTGVMSINSVDINKLENNQHTLILNGGTATE